MVGDAAYASEHLRGLGGQLTWTSRLKVTSVLHALAPPRTGKSGRPRTKGDRLGTPADLARTAVWRTAQVRRYRRTDTVEIAETICLWYGSFHTRTVRVVLVRDSKPRTRDRDDRGYGLPLVTTDLTSTPENLVARYAGRWCIEVAFFDARQSLGVGQARNRTRLAVERTVPFRPDLPEPGHHLVRHRRPLARRYRRTPVTGPLVHHQDRTVLRRHDEQAAPRHHRRQISALTPPPGNTRRNPSRPRSLARRRKMTNQNRETRGLVAAWIMLLGAGFARTCPRRSGRHKSPGSGDARSPSRARGLGMADGDEEDR
ncbi:hypothetical protein [Streptomyces sp. NPDC002758]